MTENKAAINSRLADRETLILDMQGPLNSACKNALARSFAENEGRYKNVLWNFRLLDHMDSEGAILLLVNAAVLEQKKVGLAACHLSAPLRDVFRLTSLDAAMEIFDTESEALERLPFRIGISPRDPAFPAYTGPLVPGWARSVEHVALGAVPAEAMNVNVNGRKVTSPVNGFGRLWEKKYFIKTKNEATAPQAVIALWRREFPNFWPKGNRLFTSGGGPIVPGTTALLNLSLGGPMVMATGIVVIYADDYSFCFSTVQGHILHGWINFSSFRADGGTIIQVHPVFRASDPVMEVGFRLGASRREDQFWHQTLDNLASRLGVEAGVEQRNVLIDPHVRWRQAQNVRYCGAIRSSLYLLPYWLRRIFS